MIWEGEGQRRLHSVLRLIPDFRDYRNTVFLRGSIRESRWCEDDGSGFITLFKAKGHGIAMTFDEFRVSEATS